MPKRVYIVLSALKRGFCVKSTSDGGFLCYFFAAKKCSERLESTRMSRLYKPVIKKHSKLFEKCKKKFFIIAGEIEHAS